MISLKNLLIGIIILILLICIFINCIILLNRSSKTSGISPAPPAPIKGYPTIWTISKPSDGNSNDGKIIHSNITDLIDKNTNYIIELVWSTSKPTTEDNEFSKQRYCFMFLPGTYNGVTVKMNYYTTFYGLSTKPNDIIFENSYILNPTFGNTMPGSLDNFWRSIENIYFSSTTVVNPEDKISNYKGYIYSVSQAAPLRNCIFNTDLNLFTYLGGDAAAFASGGYMSNIKCNGNISGGSQQQFCFNNVELQQGKNLDQAVWNTVLINCKNTLPKSGKETFSFNAVTQINNFKPIITIDKDINHTIYIFNSSQTPGFINLSESSNLNTTIKDTQILIINSVNDFDKINNYEAAIVYPGFYELKTSITINKNNFVFFTLGLPGIQCPNGNSAIIINADNVIVAGGLYESNPYSEVDNVINILGKNCKLFDIFIRTTIDNVCSSQSNITDAMIVVDNDSCFIDNTWLWRADHLSIDIHNGLGSNYCKSNNGLHVKPNGTKCVINGLFTEHHLEKLLQWDGPDGHVNFLQSEIPYDLSLSNARNYIPAIINGDNFNGIGMGIYCYFIDKFWNSGKYPVTDNELPIVPYAFKFDGKNYKFKYIFAKILENFCSAGGFYNLTNKDPTFSDPSPFYSYPNKQCIRINQRMYENTQDDTKPLFTTEKCDAIKCINGQGQKCYSEKVC
jgi:hypothetical protein